MVLLNENNQNKGKVSHYSSRLRILISYALRDVSKNRIVLFLTIISLSMAFAALFLSVAILDGFRKTMENGSVDTGGHLSIKSEAEGKEIENVEEIKSILQKSKLVSGFSVRSYGRLIIKIEDKIYGPGYASVGIDPVQEATASKMPQRVVQGRFLLPFETRSVVMGITLADALKGFMYDNKSIKVGEKIRYISPLTGKGRDYVVVGILDSKYFHPNWSTFFPKEELEWLDSQRRNEEIVVRVRDPDRLEMVKNELARELPKVKVFSWKEREGYVLNVIDAVVFITGNVSKMLVMATFVIVGVTIFINVFRRRRQIGILKSMGSSNRFVAGIYLFETLIYFFFSFVTAYLMFLLIHSFSLGNPIPLLIGDFMTVVNTESLVKFALLLFCAALAGSALPTYLAVKTSVVNVLRETV